MNVTRADLQQLRALMVRAIDALERTRQGELDQMALLDARSVELVAVHGKRILALLDEREKMQRVIDAAKAMRIHDVADLGMLAHARAALMIAQDAFDAALAALESEGKR